LLSNWLSVSRLETSNIKKNIKHKGNEVLNKPRKRNGVSCSVCFKDSLNELIKADFFSHSTYYALSTSTVDILTSRTIHWSDKNDGEERHIFELLIRKNNFFFSQ
jgi:hypothetical protein